MGSDLLRVVQEQQETIEEQSRLIANGAMIQRQQQETIKRQSELITELIITLENWENVAKYDGAELKERALNLQKAERQDLWK
ncbi:MAG: hypothetical protein Q4C65_02850 [Eubacteriales bacterium]|nr:hypothetical protein [Eubacteriales bacterium]